MFTQCVLCSCATSCTQTTALSTHPRAVPWKIDDSVYAISSGKEPFRQRNSLMWISATCFIQDSMELHLLSIKYSVHSLFPTSLLGFCNLRLAWYSHLGTWVRVSALSLNWFWVLTWFIGVLTKSTKVSACDQMVQPWTHVPVCGNWRAARSFLDCRTARLCARSSDRLGPCISSGSGSTVSIFCAGITFKLLSVKARREI